MTVPYLRNGIPHYALKTEKPHGVRGARAVVHIKEPEKFRYTSCKGTVCGFSDSESNFHCIWNTYIRCVVQSRNVVFIETPTDLVLSLGELFS